MTCDVALVSQYASCPIYSNSYTHMTFIQKKEKIRKGRSLVPCRKRFQYDIVLTVDVKNSVGCCLKRFGFLQPKNKTSHTPTPSRSSQPSSQRQAGTSSIYLHILTAKEISFSGVSIRIFSLYLHIPNNKFTYIYI